MDNNLVWTLIAERQNNAQLIKVPEAYTLLGKPMVVEYNRQHFKEACAWLVVFLEKVLHYHGRSNPGEKLGS